jgi:competence protein ComEC
VPVATAFQLWAQAERPALRISGEGALMGLMTHEGSALSYPKGQGFAALSWLEDDGDATDQTGAAARGGFQRAEGEVWAEVAGLKLRQFSGRGAADRVRAACGSPGLLILVATAPKDLPPDCRLLDTGMLRRTGPIAIYDRDGRPVIVTVRERSGTRLWMRGRGPATVPALLGMAARDAVAGQE